MTLKNRTLGDEKVLVYSSLIRCLPTFHGLTPRRTPGWHHWLDHWWNLNAQEVTRKLSSEPLFNRLLSLSTYSGFNFNGHLYKQNGGCGTGNLLSPVLTNIGVRRCSVDPLTHRFTTSSIRWWLRKKEKSDDPLERPNSFHPNIVFTVKENPDHFLDTAFSCHYKFNC